MKNNRPIKKISQTIPQTAYDLYGNEMYNSAVTRDGKYNIHLPKSQNEIDTQEFCMEHEM